MKIDLDSNNIRQAAAQLRVVARYLVEDMIPAENGEIDGHLPPHQRLEYIQRSRSFADAFAARDAREQATKPKRRGPGRPKHSER